MNLLFANSPRKAFFGFVQGAKTWKNAAFSKMEKDEGTLFSGRAKGEMNERISGGKSGAAGAMSASNCSQLSNTN